MKNSIIPPCYHENINYKNNHYKPVKTIKILIKFLHEIKNIKKPRKNTKRKENKNTMQ
jgi:hypothetical protein